MSRQPEATEPVTIHLTRDEVRHLDRLCGERNESRSQLVSALLAAVAEQPGGRGRTGERQSANPWGQVWPG
jgi:hypothetical protein